jgi:hypothetical protein
MKQTFKAAMIVIAVFISAPVSADIFKCAVNGKTHYQASPCAEEKHESTLNIPTVDDGANQRGQAVREEFEVRQAQKKLLDSQIAAENARAAANVARAQREGAESEARAREAEAYQRQVEIDRGRSEAQEKFLYKEAGMSPTFKR